MTHPVVEQFRSDCLDACELRRHGLLAGGIHHLVAGIRWPKLDTLTVDPTAITITYRHSHRPEIFRLSWAKSFRDSTRPWIICPTCNTRYARLLSGFAGYRCRHCHGL